MIHDTERRAKARLLAHRLAAAQAALARWMARRARAVCLLLFFLATAVISEGANATAHPAGVRTAAENAGGQGRQPCGAFSAVPVFLADAFSQLKSGEIENWLMRVAGVLSLALLVLMTRKAWLDNFGRKPPLDDAIETLRNQLEGLAPAAKVDRLIEQIGAAASREELAKVMTLLMEKERDLGAQIKDVRSYAHEGMHGLRGEMQMLLSAGEGREHRLGEKLEEHVKYLNRERSVSTARLHERIEAMSNTLRGEFESKLRIVHQDITDLPGRLLTMLQQTGQIGSNGRGGKS